MYVIIPKYILPPYIYRIISLIETDLYGNSEYIIIDDFDSDTIEHVETLINENVPVYSCYTPYSGCKFTSELITFDVDDVTALKQLSVKLFITKYLKRLSYDNILLVFFNMYLTLLHYFSSKGYDISVENRQNLYLELLQSGQDVDKLVLLFSADDGWQNLTYPTIGYDKLMLDDALLSTNIDVIKSIILDALSVL